MSTPARAIFAASGDAAANAAGTGDTEGRLL